MYTVDQRDRVVELADVPESAAGAPMPALVADERLLGVAYHLADGAIDRYRRVLESMPHGSSAEPIGLIRFTGAMSHMFGMPNDEVLAGHPLASRGLGYYGAYEVLESSWIRALERINAVHTRHDRASFLTLRHFALTFHDSTFECVAGSYEASVGWAELDAFAARAIRAGGWAAG